MKKMIFLCYMLYAGIFSFAQTTDSIQRPGYFSGVITATNNGISLLPNFSLNKPAVVFDGTVGKNRWAFNPVLSFSMEGQPWTFVFWVRYKLIDHKQFAMNVSAHPAFSFKTIAATLNGLSADYITTNRYLAVEITPTYFINEKAGIGIYYLASHGLDKSASQYMHFAAIRSILSNIELSKQLNLTLVPQFYYLNIDHLQGTYVTATIFLSKKNLPFSLSSIVSKALSTEIAGKDFVWNVGLNYNFNRKFYQAD